MKSTPSCNSSDHSGSTAHGFHDRKDRIHEHVHQRIQIWEHAVTEVDRSPDIVGGSHCTSMAQSQFVNIGGVDREARLENTVLDPSDEQLCLGQHRRNRRHHNPGLHTG